MSEADERIEFEKYFHLGEAHSLVQDIGKLIRVVGSLYEGYLPGAILGSICKIHPFGKQPSTFAEVVGFNGRKVLMMPLGEVRGVGMGSKLTLESQIPAIQASDNLLGRVINGMGEPIDDKGEIEASKKIRLYSPGINPLNRKPIREPLDVGINTINGLLTIGKGQRIGIMSGSGVGKSVLIGMMARYTTADVNVIALIGERGREVKEFLDNDLGEEGLKRSVVVVATSDQSPLVRMRGAFLATAIAEYFAIRSKSVLLMMDSVTRFAMAQREIGLNVGEPPTSKGYTPSVFALLPKLLERAGNFTHGGNITGFYSVLVEGDDMDDPIADAVRSIVDGHIVLSRKLSERGHYPAIDVLQSTSRVMRFVTNEEHQKIAQEIRENISVYREAEDLINLGAYHSGANPKIDKAIALNDAINEFMQQKIEEGSSMAETFTYMQDVLSRNEGLKK